MNCEYSDWSVEMTKYGFYPPFLIHKSVINKALWSDHQDGDTS